MAEVSRLVSLRPNGLNSLGPETDGTGIWCSTTDKEMLAAPDPKTILGARYPVTMEYGEPATSI